MAEVHTTFTAQGQETTPIALQGNFTVTIKTDSDWKGGAIVLEKQFVDNPAFIPLSDGIFFKSATVVGNEPGNSVVNYRLRVHQYHGGSAYVRIEDGN